MASPHRSRQFFGPDTRQHGYNLSVKSQIAPWTDSANGRRAANNSNLFFSRDTMDITGHDWGINPVILSGLNCVCARNTFDAPQGRGERCTHARARLGLGFRRTLMIGRGMSGIKGLVSSRISNSLTTHGTWLSRPGLGQDETPRSITASWAINPSQGDLLLRREAFVFLVILFSLTTFMYHFHSRW